MAGRLSIFMRLGRNIIPVNGDGDAYRSGEKALLPSLSGFELSHSLKVLPFCLPPLSLSLLFSFFLRPLIVFEF